VLGSGGNDTAFGNRGADVLFGGNGVDSLSGGNGADDLYGGLGQDRLRGGNGADEFRFDDGDSADAFLNLGGGGTIRLPWRDHILDFSNAQGDRINLSLIDANVGDPGDQAFVWEGQDPSIGSGELRWYTSGSSKIIEGNIDADSQPELVIELENVGFNLTQSMFIL
jgi:Ca2+-binding RTX toxin-like protein